MLRLYSILFVFLYSTSSFAFEYQDSLLNVVNNLSKTNRSNRASALIELSKFYWTNNTDSAISMSNTVILLGEELDNSTIIGNGYFNLGMIEYVNGSFANGYGSFLQAVTYFKENKEDFLVSQSLLHAGFCLRKTEQYSEAVLLIQEGYDIIKATHHYQLAYSMAKELGELYALIEENIEAEKYFKESIKISLFHGDTIASIQSYIAIGCFYQEIFEYKKSLNSLHSALKMTNPGDKQVLAQLYNHIGETLLLDNQLNEATNYFNLGLLTAKEGNSKLTQSRSHLNLSKIYELQQKYALALIEFKLFNQINDSINTVLKTQTISDLQAKFDNAILSKELHLKDLEVEKTQIEINDSEVELKNQSFQKKIIIGSLGVVLIFGFILLFAFRKQKQLNIKLDQLSIVAREIENTVIITDKDGELEWMNDSYERNYGLNIDQFKKKYGKNLLKTSASKIIQEKIEYALKEKKTVQYFISNVDKNGEERHLRTTLTPTLDEDGNIRKVILIDTEVTDILLAEKQITKQRDELQHVNTQVAESIDYALRIQESILPHSSKIKNYFKEYFLFYNPKDVVSGDFYFVEETEKYIYFAGADCTGHGVPGALMSVICHNLLENAVHKGKENTDEILMELNSQIIRKLRQSSVVDENIKDGLDIALCRISKSELKNDTKMLQYSGAHSGIYLVNESQLTEIKPDRVHLGTDIKTSAISRNEITIKAGTEIILFSDGFADQKGSKTNKKFYYKPFRDLILEMSTLESEKKSEFLAKNFESWKGDLQQADDVFVWGLKI